MVKDHHSIIKHPVHKGDFFFNLGKKDEPKLEKEIAAMVASASKPPDGIDGFLIRLGESLRKMPYRARTQVEMQIMKIVFEKECELGTDY